MAGTAQSPLPHMPSPALASAGVAGRAERQLPAVQLLVFGAALLALFASAAVLVAPQVTSLYHRINPPRVDAPAPVLTAAELDAVVSYAQQMRADDALVQVRPGVYAKRSNVEGVQVGGRTVFYDVLPHQSFGPLRAGRVAESDVTVLSRQNAGDSLVVVYALK